MAAGEGLSRRRRVPGSGERLHRGDDRRPQAVQRGALQGDAGPDQADRSQRPHPDRPLLLLPPHRRGPAVPDPLPQAGGVGRGLQRVHCGRGAPRPERDGEGPGIPVGGRVRGERRRRTAHVLDRHHRIPPVQAVREGPEDGRRPGSPRGEGDERNLGGRQPDRVLRDGAPGDEAIGHPVAPRASAASRRRSTRKRTSSSRSGSDGPRTRSSSCSAAGYRHVGPPAPARVVAGRRVPAGAAPREGPQVRRRAPRRHPLHPHEQGREELPPRHGAARGPLARAVEAVRRAPPGRAARGRRGLQGLRRAPGEAGGPQPPPRARLLRRPVEGGRLPRARLHRIRVRHAGVRLEAAPLRLPEPHHALERVRLRHGGRRVRAAQARGRPRWFRPGALRLRAALGHGARRREGADQHRLPEGPRPRRQGPAVALRLRLLRLRHVRHLRQPAPEPSRPRDPLRHRPRPGRQRDGRGVARRRHADEEEEHVLRLHRLRRVPRQGEVDLSPIAC